MDSTLARAAATSAGVAHDAVAAASAPDKQRQARIRSLDIVRGAVMALMVLDHVRIFFSNFPFDPTDLARSSTAMFLTRWATHFCAPAFIFLAGVGAYLYGRREGDRRLTWFLLSRGAWLIIIEMTLARLGWTFNFDYANFIMAGVIWVIGWCMILLAGLIHLPIPAVAAFALLVVFGHNLLDALPPDTVAYATRTSHFQWLWRILYFGGAIRISGGPLFIVLYSIVPWVGVIAAGYAFGPVMRWTESARRAMCLFVGLGAILTFLVLRGFDLYGESGSWVRQESWWSDVLSFIRTKKYPASLLFLLMTLGPTIALLPVLERMRGRISAFLAVLGRVPFLFYILHLPIIHALAVLFCWLREGRVNGWLTMNHPLMAPPAPLTCGYDLWVVYLVSAFVVLLLYWPCRWFAEMKNRSRHPLLSFL